MASLVYACRFEVPSSELTPVIDAYRHWIEHHYTERRGIADFSFDLLTSVTSVTLPSDHSLKSVHYVTGAGEVITIEWSYPADHDTTLRWRNSVRIGRLTSCCSIEHLIWIDSVEYQISPVRFALGSPSVIRSLCSEQSVYVGEMKLQANAYALKATNVSDLVELLLTPLRKLPLIFLSPYAEGDRNLIDADAMARRLAGVAIVVAASDVNTTWEMSDRIGRTLSCFNGGARIYWPGFAISDDPRRHPLYLAERIESVSPSVVARAIDRSIFTVASFRFVADNRINDVIRDAEQAQRVLQLESQRASSGIDWESYAIEIDKELSVTKQRFAEIEAENENLRANQQVFLATRPVDFTEDVSPEEIVVPETMKEAVELAKGKCTNLIVLDSAVKSAASSPFQRPAEIFEALHDLDDIASAWSKLKVERGNGGDLRQHLSERGWGKRCSMHISDTTRNRYKADYTFTHNSKPELFEPHVTVGSGDANSCASIHFLLDEEAGKIVVAHVGRHLPNTKT
jgi:hypothetical protein